MPGYLVKHEQVALSGTPALHIRSLLDRQQYADPLGEAEALGISSATWPLFGLLWPSAQQLATYMAGRPRVDGERVLEVGCGLALASMVCHRLGVDVTASDCHPLAGAFLQENLLLNALLPLPYRHGDWAADPLLAPREGRARVEGQFNVIMGSDVLYERDDGGCLAAFIQRHACAVAEVLIVDPNRGNRSAFNRQMAALGFALEDLPLVQPLADGSAYKGRLLRYRRTALLAADQAGEIGPDQAIGLGGIAVH
jgi:predicted nicotinamide N-methyase